MPKEFENDAIWDYDKAEEFVNAWIRLFESNPQTKHVADRYPIMGVYSHGETWAVKNYKLAVYYQNPHDTDSEYLVIQWLKLTRVTSKNEEETLLRLDCVYNTNHTKMEITIPH